MTLRVKRARARAKEASAYRRWRRAVKRYDKEDRRRRDAFRVYSEARAFRRGLDKVIKKVGVTGVDAEGIEFIKKEEGFRRAPYNDSRGFATVGVGHLIAQRRVTDADRRRWTLSDAEVNALLRRDLERFEKVVRSAFKGKLKPTQSRFNAAVSLAFNIGTGGFAKSTVFRKIRSGDLHGAANAFLMWDVPSELRPRRERERHLFLK